MRKLLLFLLAGAALAQTPDPSQQGGRFIAANYGQWQAQVVTATPSVVCVQPTTFTLYNNSTFKPWNTNAPILVGQETVTPTSFDFISQPGQVCISAPYVLPHFGGDVVRTGTAGLQEALNAAGQRGGGVVTLDANWTGTSAMKSAAVIPTNVGIEDARTGAGAGGSGPANTATYFISKNCAGLTNCTQILGDGQVIVDATTNSTTTITCPNNDCNFTSADVGKSVWAVQRGSGSNTFTGGTLICGNSVPVPTIATVNSAQSITITGSNCTASVTALAILVWGHKDGAALHAMSPGCTTISFPANATIIFDDSFLITVPPCATGGLASATGNPQPNLVGSTTSSTVWIPSPDFKWSDCTGTGAVSGSVCVGSALSQIWYFTAWGGGAIASSVTNCANASGKTFLSHAATGGGIYFVNLSGLCGGQSGFTGAELNSFDDQWSEGGVQNVGTTGLVVSATAVNTQSLDNYETAVPGTNAIGLSVLSTGQLNDYGSYLISCANVSGVLYSRGVHFVNGGGAGFPCIAAVTVQSGGIYYSDGDFFNQDVLTGATNSVGLSLQSGGKGAIRNAKIGASAGSQVAISNAGTLVSQGGNVVTSGVVQSDFITGSGVDFLTGGCTGTATAASTLGLFGQLGQGSTATCTSTTVTVGTVMSRPGTIVSLAVLAGTAGVNASSGVVTLLKNGVATTSTCTLGTGTTCKDFTHQPTYVAGDILSVQFTTQAADTLANVKVSVAAW